MNLDVLKRPCTSNEIEWRIAGGGNYITIVPYIDNRCVMSRFDEQFGWSGWSNVITPIAGGFLCTITVTTPDDYISKTDGAPITDVEPIKGGISDAMKRCAVQFGLGRDLYNYPKVMYMPTEEKEKKYIPDWVKKRIPPMVDAIVKGTFTKDLVIFENK